MIQRLGQAMILCLGMQTRHLGRNSRLVEYLAEVEPLGFPVLNASLHVEQISAADQVVEFADTELRHDLAHFFGNEEEVVHDVLGLAGEALAQHRVLGGDTNRTGVEVALAHHDAAFDHQRRRSETEFIGAKQRADDDVATGLHLTVDLHTDTATQAVEHQGLLRLGQTQFPRRAGVLDRRQRRSARAAIVTGDDDMVGLGLGDAGSNRTDTDFGNQFDRDRRRWIGVFQVMDQLRQIFDRVDVVVRRRRNEADARHRVPQEADVLGHFVPRQLTALAGLGALRHLDLDLVRVHQVLGGNAKAAGGHLLDRRTQGVAVLHLVVTLDARLADDVGEHRAALDRRETLRVLATFTGVRFSADTVHGNCQSGVRFGRDRAERHGTSGEALDDILGRLDFFERHRGRLLLEFEQAAQRQVALALVVDDRGVFLVGVTLAGTRGMLQLGDGIRRPHVLFAANAEGIVAAGIKHFGQHGIIAEGPQVRADGFLRDFENTDAFHI